MKNTKENITLGLTPSAKADVTEIVSTIIARELENFARMVKRGFDEVFERLDQMVTKKEFHEFKDRTESSLYELKTDMIYVKDRLTGVEDRLDKVEGRLDGIESFISDHEDRISDLEIRIA